MINLFNQYKIWTTFHIYAILLMKITLYQTREYWIAVFEKTSVNIMLQIIHSQNYLIII